VPDTRRSGRGNGDGAARRRQIGYAVLSAAVMLAAVFALGRLTWRPLAPTIQELPYSEFRQRLTRGEVDEVTIDGPRITGRLKGPGPASAAGEPPLFVTVSPSTGDGKLLDALDAAGVKYQAKMPGDSSGTAVVSWLLTVLLLGVLWAVALRRPGATGAGGFGVGRSKATEVTAADVGVTFRDIGGADEAIAELQEIIQFLKTPQRFARLGGKIPKGVLLVGPPGTGKTLIAKATAGEAQVPFFETSGSEFVEMFVGVGAARVRDLFEQARRVAPAIVFIDEIDAIGQSRGAALRIVTDSEREQTLNQLLAEIDGFKSDVARPVIIMAATNRPELLDPALLRAGRFDRQVALGNPDLAGRRQILAIHTRRIHLAAGFDLERAARVTPGFSGADLANVVNEAALLAARRNAEAVTFTDFEAAMERVIAGLEKRTRVMSEGERRAVACHESGHALVAHLVPHADPVSKVSIVPRSRGALGYTLQMPAEDRYLLTREELDDRLAVMLAGRAAEQLMFGTASTGANDDLQHATDLARRMVTEFGMSEHLGPVRYAGPPLQYLAGAGDLSQVSPHTRDAIDTEIQRVIGAQLDRAERLLAEHRGALEWLTGELLACETVDGRIVTAALERQRCVPPQPLTPGAAACQDGPLVPTMFTCACCCREAQASGRRRARVDIVHS
jgi:cell division protease FtsH